MDFKIGANSVVAAEENMAAGGDNNVNVEQSIIANSAEDEKGKRKIFALKAGLFLTGVTIVSAVAGFGTSFSAVKRREKEVLMAAGFSEAKAVQVLAHDDAARLALRALGWGSVLAVTGVSLICYTVWKVSGAKDFEEFRLKAGTLLPKIPKNENHGRSEFDNFNDFLSYVSKKPEDNSKDLNIADVVRSLDDARGRAVGVSDLFLPAVQVQRSKLHELCYRLILLDPTVQGKRGEDVLWRKGYHDVLATARTFKENDRWSEEDTSLILGLLTSGVGYYYHLLLKLQADYGLDALLSVDFPLFMDDYGLPKGKGSSGRHEEATWAQPFAARVLVYLGDLARYLCEVEPGWDLGSATRLYHQSACVDPTQGRPHNQLGSLAGSRNFSLSAVFHYLRSLSCAEPFQGALGNLYKALERNVTATQTFSGPAHKAINKLLVAVDSWYCDKQVDDLSAVFSEMIESVKQAIGAIGEPAAIENLDWEKPFAITDSSDRLSTSNTVKFIAVLLLCADKLRTADSPRLPEIHSILLAIANHIIQLLATRWKAGGAKRRRRRRRLSAGSARSDSSGSVSVSGSSGGESDSSDDDSTPAGPNKAETALTNGFNHGANQPSADEELLQPLNLLFCWMRTLPDLWSNWPLPTKMAQRNVVAVLNALEDISVDEGSKDLSKIPLPEDVALRGVAALEASQADLDWTLCPRLAEEAKARLHRILETGKLLAGMNYDAHLQRFVIEKPGGAQSENRCKGELMKHMGQLWLQAEVRALESRTSGPSGTSPYLAVDAHAMVDHIAIVKHIVGSRQFILVIPTVALSIVDDWKHDSGRSREAIRWLESQFLRGNRALRAQKAHERLPFSLIKYPKKKDKEAWNAFQMLECCHFFRKQNSLQVTLLRGSQSPPLTSEATALATSFGINIENIETFYNKWKESKTQAKT